MDRATEINAKDYFVNENTGTAYIGPEGLSLSNKFLVNKKGQTYLKEGMLGGTLPDAEKISDIVNFANWREGWKFNSKGQFFNEYYEDGKIVDFCMLQNKNAGDINYYLCLGSPKKTDFSQAVFKVSKAGNVSISAAEDSENTTNGYAKNGFKAIRWNTNNTVKYQCTVSPNRLYFYNSVGKPADTTGYQYGAAMYYVPGYIYGTAKKKVGNFLKTTAPVNPLSIYLTPDNIRAVTWEKTGSSGYHYNNTYYFYFGPREADVAGSKNSFTTKPTGYTHLRGRSLRLQAFGDATGKFNGLIYYQSAYHMIPYEAHLYALRSGYTTPRVGEDYGNTAHILSLATRTWTVDKTTYTRINRLVIGDGRTFSRTKNGKTENYGRISGIELRTPAHKGIYLKVHGALSDTNNGRVLYIGALNYGTASSPKMRLTVRCQYNNSGRLGSASYRWHKVYANNYSTGSDARLKFNIHSLNTNNNLYMQAYDLLRPVSFNYFNEEDKAEEEQVHFGFVAQEVEAALNQVGINPQEFAALECDNSEEGDGYYSLDYSKFVALNTAKIKQLESIIMTQQQQINALQAKLG